MPEQDPYQAPETDVTNYDSEALLPSATSKIPKVFGILHIIYAVIGGIGGLVIIFTPRSFKSTLTSLQQYVKEREESVASSSNAYSEWEIIATVDGTIRIILAVVLLIAGIHLLQQKSSGVTFTRLWAVTRMIVAVPLVYLTLRTQLEMMSILESIEFPIGMRGTKAISAVFEIIILCIYPLINLIILSRPSVKNSLSK